jgi:hypothetical protein
MCIASYCQPSIQLALLNYTAKRCEIILFGTGVNLRAVWSVEKANGLRAEVINPSIFLLTSALFCVIFAFAGQKGSFAGQHSHKWTATKKLPPISCMPPLCGSGRFPALPYSPQRRIEYGKMLLPQSDKSMKSCSPTTFETIIIFSIFLLDRVRLMR